MPKKAVVLTGDSLREPYDSKYCKTIDCHYRQGNKCTLQECVRNHKAILYWQITGRLHLMDGGT